jgi:hypothetical protein
MLKMWVPWVILWAAFTTVAGGASCAGGQCTQEERDKISFTLLYVHVLRALVNPPR